MDEIMDTKVVQMKFDNSQFRAGVEDTIKQLTNLENSLEMQGASRGLENVAKASKETSKAMNVMGESVESVHLAFSYLEVAGITAMVRLTNAALSYGKRIAANLWSKSIGQVISGGKIRSQNIEHAKFQLEGLGVAWEDIVDDINYGVKDTAYGLDSAARAASQLVASQVQLGEEMRTALRSISGVAAMTNSTYDEISSIWTTVASNGKLMTMQLRQLSAKGLATSAQIAKYYREVKGVADATEATINEMVSKGQISFQDFANAMDWAFGDHAKEANKTFSGALSNMNAALSRIGQKFADPAYENLRKVFIALTDDIDAVNKALQPAMDAFSTILGDAERVTDKFLTNEHFVKGLIALAVDFWTWVRTILSAIQELSGAGVYIDNVTIPFENLAKSLQLYGDKAEYVKNIIKDIISVGDIFIHGIKSALTILKPLGEAILEGIGLPIQKLKEEFEPGWIYQHKEALKAVMDVIAKFVAMKLANVIRDIVAAIRSIDWKTVLKAIVVIVNITAKAITLIPDLIRLVQAVFAIVVKSIMAAVLAIVWFKNEVANAIDFVGQSLSTKFGKIFGSFSPAVAIQADTSSVEESVDNTMKTVSASTENATESVDELNDSMDETAERIDGLEKTAARSGREIERSYKGVGEAAKSAAEEVEESSDRIQVAGKGFNPRGFNPGNPLGDDQRDKSELDGSTNYGKSDQESSKIFSRLTDKEKSGIKGMFDKLAEYAGIIESDTEGQKKVVSAFDVWFGGLADMIHSKAGEWIGKISLAIMSILPLIGVIGIVAGKVIIAMAVWKTVFKAIKAVWGILDAIAGFFKNITYFGKAIYKNAVANELRAVAEVIKSLVGPILAIALTIGVIVAAAYVVKKFDLEDTIQTLYTCIKSVMTIIGILMFIGFMIAKMAAMVNIFVVLSNVVTTLTKGGTRQVFRAKSTAHQFLMAMAALFIALAADLAVLAGAIKILGEMDPNQLKQGIKSLLLISSLLIVLVFVTGSFANAFRTYTYSYDQLSGALSKTPFSREKGVESKNNEMYKTLMALAGVIAVMSAAIVVLGKQDITTLAKGGVIITVAMGALVGFMAVIMKMSKSYEANSFNSVKDGDFIKEIKKGPAESATIKSVIGLISGLAGFMLAISTVMRSAKNLDPGQLGVVTAIIATSLGALTGLMAVIAWNARQATEVPSKQIKSVYTGMALTIAAVSIFMLSIAGSLRMIQNLSAGELIAGMVTITVALGMLIGFMTAMTAILKKMQTTSELVVLAGSLMTMSIALSIMLLAIAGMFAILQNINWSAMEGSAGYLIGAGAFIAAMVGLILALTVVANGNYGPIVAASIGIFGGISLMLWALSNTFTVLGAIDWSGVKEAQSVLLILLGAIVIIGILCTVIAALGPEVSGPAIAAVVAMSSLFIAMGAMFAAIGMCVALIGQGVQQITDAIHQLFVIPWDRTSSVAEGLEDLIDSLAKLAKFMKPEMLQGALMFAGFVLAMSLSLRALTGIDQEAVKQAGEVLNQFVMQFSKNIPALYGILDFATAAATLMPVIIGALTLAAVMLPIGGAALILFGAEMIIFAAMMTAVGEQIGPAFQIFVDAITNAGSIILNSGLELLAGFAAIFAVAALSIVVGTLLTAGGLAMAAGAGLMYLAGLTLGAGITAVVKGISKAGAVILENSNKILKSALVLSAFSVIIAAVGTVMIAGGSLFAAGSLIMIAGATSILVAMKIYKLAGDTGVQTVNKFRLMVAGLYSLAKESQNLGTAFAWAGNMIIIGLLNGLEAGVPLINEAIVDLATMVITSFKETLGIASPATEMIEAAYWTVQGFIQGLVENAPSLQEVCTDIVTGVINIFSGGSDSIAAEGADAGIGFLSNVQDVMVAGAPGIAELNYDIGNAWGDNLGSGYENGFKRHIQNLINYENELAGHLGPANWTQAEYSAYLEEAQRSGPNSTATQQIISRNNANAENRARNSGLIGQIPTYTPLSTLGIDTGYIDIDEIYRNLGGSSGGGGVGTTSDMAAAIAGSSGAGSGINDQSKAASIGGGVGNTITNSNNTYNFYQNNYSPEPLNRSAIYQQTRQQLNGFYTYVKEKNLSY